MPVESSAKSTVPESNAWLISAEPLNGTSWASKPASLANRSAPSRDVMVPAPMLSLPGLAFALAISSLMLFGPSLARTTISDMFLVSSEISEKSLSGS